MRIHSGNELLKVCREEGLSIWQCALAQEESSGTQTKQQLWERMAHSLQTMRTSAHFGLEHDIVSVSGLTGGDAKKYYTYAQEQSPLCGEIISLAVSMALSNSEVNASMRRIVACPTAGSCGIVPAALISVGNARQKTDDDLIRALFTASMIGIIIGENATLAGAEGGCQAECGAAAAMAAAALVEMLGGTPKQALHGASMTMKTVLGLVCDPVCGLVEIPCIKRNAACTANAIVCADMALAGVESRIPFDEVVWAMHQVGMKIPVELRETALGGLAATPTAKQMAKDLHMDEA